LDRPPAINSNENGATAPAMFAVSHADTGSI
jgi:hypothetical protein